MASLPGIGSSSASIRYLSSARPPGLLREQASAFLELFLVDLAEAYRYYRSMMEYWHATLPIPILDVSYEELVENQEPMTRKLLAHCDLPWDERCLHPHETDRDVRTASYWQVRQPIYRSSVARWKCFEKHLGPLIEGLGEYARNGREAWGSKR